MSKYKTIQIDCTGEAHKNEAYADNCGVCMPEWGKITVCADCNHRPRGHAEDGCHASANPDDMASERCGCKHKFTREGGKRTKLFEITVEGGVVTHGTWQETSNSRKADRSPRTWSVRALTSGEALREARRVLKEVFESHKADCPKEDCLMDYASVSTRGTSGTAGGYERADSRHDAA